MNDAKVTFETKWKMTKYQQKLVRQDLRTLVSFPIFKSGNVDINDRLEDDKLLAILSLDSDEDLLDDFSIIGEGYDSSDIGQLMKSNFSKIADVLRM